MGLAMYLMEPLSPNPDSMYEEVKKAIELNPKLVEAHIVMGELFLLWPTPTEGDPVASFKEALRLDPDNAWAHYGLGMLHSKSGNHEGLIRQYNILKKLDSELADDLHGHGQMGIQSIY